MSPVWKRGSMLMPCVLTYVVEPPSASGQKSHTATSTSALTALMLAALLAAFMAKAPVRGQAGRPSGRPACTAEGLLDHRDGNAVEVGERASRGGGVAGHDDDRGVPGGLDRARVRGADDDRAARGLERHGGGLAREVRGRGELDGVDDGRVGGVLDVV